MRIVIAGGGVMGLLTAVSCVSAGHEVVLVDQAGIPFPGAASFDRHRVLRALHLDDPLATAAAVRAHHSGSACSTCCPPGSTSRSAC